MALRRAGIRMKAPTSSKLVAAWLLGAACVNGNSEDWPAWRGPNRNGITSETLPETLPQTASIAWRARVGTGFSGISVADGGVFTMGNAADRDLVWRLDARTGEVVWKHDYECALDPLYFEGGPCATPTVAGNFVYTLSRKGHVHCLEKETGAVRWRRDLVRDHTLKLPEWSFAGSVYLVDNLAILNVGGGGAALDRRTGETVWFSDPRTAGYATAVPAESAGKEFILLFGARDLMGIEPGSGRVFWRLPWETGREVNAADPIVEGRRFHLSSSIGSAVYELGERAAAPPREIWRNKSLRCYFNAPVLSGGHLYAIHGTTHRPTELVCLDWETGETKWKEPGFGSGGLVATPQRGILFDKGVLTVFKLTPDAYCSEFSQQVLGGKCWTVPTLANGVVYCRNAKGDLAAASLRSPVASKVDSRSPRN